MRNNNGWPGSRLPQECVGKASSPRSFQWQRVCGENRGLSPVSNVVLLLHHSQGLIHDFTGRAVETSRYFVSNQRLQCRCQGHIQTYRRFLSFDQFKWHVGNYFYAISTSVAGYRALSRLRSSALASASPCTNLIWRGLRRMRATKLSRSFWSAWAE